MKELLENTGPGTYTEGMPWNPVEQVIFNRRSIRSFKEEPIPDAMIRRILEAGRFAPSAGNFQPWRFIVIKDKKILTEMEKDAVRFIKLLMFFLDYTKGGFLRRLLVKPIAKIVIRFKPNEFHPVPFGLMSQIAKGQTLVFHNAPTLILMLKDRRGVSNPDIDIGICGQNMVLAAHSLGAGTCWIGLIKVLMYFPKWRKLFNITYPYQLDVCLALGWQKPKADGPVPREVQLVEWFDNGTIRIEKQGE
ncbi:MAG TPA: nitroreductase family protein [Spirochaetota bacterium]|nr:nitroreductase family protein [Spirochaetota bacterium]HOM11146.1 nitroreductase family protein [Spirochaetota bacterium]HPP50921.1 nitroreductase family protein [Spirochaetota bacterium]